MLLRYLFAFTLATTFVACSSTPPELVDMDSDDIPDAREDRNQDGMVDPGETDPNSDDTDMDGIPDDEEVEYLACGVDNDRPFEVSDVPGARSLLLVDGQVSHRELLFTTVGGNPGASFYDPGTGVAAVLISRTPGANEATPERLRATVRDDILNALGQVENQQSRGFTTHDGFPAEQAKLQMTASAPVSASEIVNRVASELLGGLVLSGTAPMQGQVSTQVRITMLTVRRSDARALFLVAVAVGDPAEAEIRLDELTDGTNLALRGSFTRHVCDPFQAEANAAADILWVVDDSGSMEDDQMAVRAAADAMADVLTSAEVDYRLAVTRTRADDGRNDPRRGRLEGAGFTRMLNDFQRDIVVGADGGWEPGLFTGIEALDNSLPPTAEGEAEDPFKLRDGAARIVIHLSDERDQDVECAACGSCDGAEGEPRSCTEPQGQQVIDSFIADYQSREAVTFALVGDLPDGCLQMGGNQDDNFEPGQGYVEVANATGGRFGSLCGDMRSNLEDVARVAIGVASSYLLSAQPASATIRVAVGPAGMGVVVPRSRTNGFDYDPASNKVIFYGDAKPVDGDEIVVAYRRWDRANDPGTPADPCDDCADGTVCNPELDIVDCGTPCGEVLCEPGLACIPDSAGCGDPSTVPVETECGECDPGLVCNPVAGDCVPPCEDTGCAGTEICNTRTHLCEDSGV